MAMDYRKLHALARHLNQATNHTWRLDERSKSDYAAVIMGDRGAVISVSSYYPSQHRWKISGGNLESSQRHKLKPITVDPNRPSKDIAKDVNKRLLVKYWGFLEESKKIREANKKESEQKEVVTNLFKKVLQPSYSTHDDRYRYGCMTTKIHNNHCNIEFFGLSYDDLIKLSAFAKDNLNLK